MGLWPPTPEVFLYSFDFKSKLQRLNSNLFVNDALRKPVDGEFFSTSLCLARGKRSDQMTAGQYAQLDTDARKYLEDYDKGLTPDFVCGVPVGFIPEYDRIDVKLYKNLIKNCVSIERVKVQARGWRSIVLYLVKRNIVSLERARKVFDRPGLGTDEYDKLPFEDKVRWAAGFRYGEIA